MDTEGQAPDAVGVCQYLTCVFWVDLGLCVRRRFV